MRKLFLLAVLSFATYAFGQESFIIEYRQTNEMDPEKVKEFERENSKDSKGFIKISGGPDQKYELVYNQGISYYNKLELINNNQDAPTTSFSISIGGEYKALVNNPSENAFKQEITLDKKDFILKSPYKDYQWKITDIEETILGYKTIKAISEIDGKRIAAWYAPELKVDAGPNQINGLPGVILKSISENGGKFGIMTKIEAEKININPKRLPKIKSLKGIEISPEDFKKLQEISKEKMRQSFSLGVDKD